MTKEQIKAAIAANLAGQGSMVDISGQLPAILNAIVDAIPEGGGSEPLIVSGVISEMSGTITVSEEDLQKIATAFNAGNNVVIEADGDGYKLTVCGYDSANYFCAFNSTTTPSEELGIYKYIVVAE